MQGSANFGRDTRYECYILYTIWGGILTSKQKREFIVERGPVLAARAVRQLRLAREQGASLHRVRVHAHKVPKNVDTSDYHMESQEN